MAMSLANFLANSGARTPPVDFRIAWPWEALASTVMYQTNVNAQTELTDVVTDKAPRFGHRHRGEWVFEGSRRGRANVVAHGIYVLHYDDDRTATFLLVLLNHTLAARLQRIEFG